MPWVRLDDGFTEHPKIVAAGGDAAWLHVCALAYSNRNLTDGTIPKGVLVRLSDRKEPQKLALRLCDNGLWIDEGDRWRIHDFHDFQPTAEQVKHERAQARERQRRRRAKQLADPDPESNVTPMSRRESR